MMRLFKVTFDYDGWVLSDLSVLVQAKDEAEAREVATAFLADTDHKDVPIDEVWPVDYEPDTPCVIDFTEAWAA